MKFYGVTIQMKATEQYFPVVLFIMLYKLVPTCEPVDKFLCFFFWLLRSGKETVYCWTRAPPLTRLWMFLAYRKIPKISPGAYIFKGPF